MTHKETRGVIYMISCANSAKVYIGSTLNPRQRWSSHLHQLRQQKHHAIHLQRSFDRHGEEAFTFSIVETVEDVMFLTAREQFWMWRLAGRLYNIRPRADSCLGCKRSPEATTKTVARMLGNTIRRGSQMPSEARAKISKSLAGNQYRAGIPHTDADKAKIGKGVARAYAEGRRTKPDAEIARRNLADWNARVASGQALPGSAKPQRNADLIGFFRATRSRSATAAKFGITINAVSWIIRRHAPDLAGRSKTNA